MGDLCKLTNDRNLKGVMMSKRGLAMAEKGDVRAASCSCPALVLKANFSCD